MMSIDGAITVLATLVMVVATYVFRKGKDTKKNPQVTSPPKNKAADKAIESVQESFQEEVDRIKSATTSDSPADELADLGNARKR